MKKIIAILLVLVIGFSAFAVVSSTDANLNLKASVLGTTLHGFGNTHLSSVPLASSVLALGDLDSSASLNLLTTTSATVVGHYNLFSTGTTAIKVAFELTPLKLGVGGLDYYVPYQVTLGTLNSVGVSIHNDFTAVSSKIDLGIAAGPAAVATGGTAGIANTSRNVLKNTGVGVNWGSVPVLVEFDNGANEAFGLPASTEGYVGFITAKISAL